MRFAPLLRFLLRASLGGVFVVSGFEKLVSPSQNFAALIGKFEILHGPAVSVLALTLPWVEFIGGVLLVLGLWTRVSLAVLWAVNTVFIGVLASAFARRLPIESCGCFGKGILIPLPAMLAIDSAAWFLFLACFLLRRRPTPSLDSFLDRT